MNWDVHGGNIRHESAWKGFSNVENWKMHFFFHEIRQQVIWKFHWRENDLQSAYRLSPNSGQAFDSNVRGMIEFIVNPFSFYVFRWDLGTMGFHPRRGKEIQPSIHLGASTQPYFNHLPDLFSSILLLNWIYLESTFFEYRPKRGAVLQRKLFHACTPHGKQIEPRSHTRRTLSGMDYGTIKTIKASG